MHHKLPTYKNTPPPPKFPSCYSAMRKLRRDLFIAYRAGSEAETIFGYWNINWDSLSGPEKIRRIRAFLNWYNGKLWAAYSHRAPKAVVVTHTFTIPE